MSTLNTSLNESTHNNNEMPPLVKEAKAKIEALEYKSALQFLAGVREVANEFNKKNDAIELHIAETRDDLANKLENIRECKRDLLFLKESLMEYRDEYIRNAQMILQQLERNCPDILEAFDRLSIKKNKLKRNELETKGNELLNLLNEAVLSNNLERIQTLLESAFVHEIECNNFDFSSDIFSTSFTDFAQKTLETIKSKFLSYLDKLKYPFEEGGVISVNKEESIAVQKYVNILCILLKRLAADEWTTSVAEILFEPINDRFSFHFYGDRKTNDKANPRWFLTQILAWIRANSTFFEQTLHEIEKQQDFNASVFFHYKMSNMASDKIKSLLACEDVLTDNVIFSKLVDECVEFEEERQMLDRLNHGINTLSPFCEQRVIMAWIRIENEISLDYLDEILSNENRWSSRLGEIEEADEYAVCQCIDAFLTLILCIQNRSRLLTDTFAKRRFFDLQLFLFDEFRERLSQISNTAESPWTEPFPQIMNGIWFLCDTLKEWSEINLFDERDTGNSSLESTSRMYRHLWSQLADDIANSLKVQTSEMAHQYQQNKWARVDILTPTNKEISSNFCPILMKLRSIFASAGNVLSQSSLKTAFKRFTTIVANVFLKEVVQCTAFVESGAAQMLYDVEEGLIPVLDNIFIRNNVQSVQCIYNKEMLKLVGSLRLLSLPWPVATLLREEISNNSPEQIEEKLLEMKLTSLTAEDALKLFSLRSDMKNTGLIAMTVR